MASYFDEHDCEPSDPEQETRTNMLLELARSLFNRMDFEDLGLVVDWDHHLPPPAAKTVVENLPRTVIRGSQAALTLPWAQYSSFFLFMDCWGMEEEWQLGAGEGGYQLMKIRPRLEYYSTFLRQIPVPCAAMSCPLMTTLMRSTDEIRLENSSSNTDWRTSMEPCTREEVGAECWPSASSLLTLNPH
ncbi:E3 ubiquitin-protein ligase RNF181 isoform X1 [Pan troglodytes]|nr:E3 ubiquitin-protein ligase RNF181 isoform X1 [Pan troglodytes]